LQGIKLYCLVNRDDCIRVFFDWTSVAACQLDICFVVDYSGSIRDTNPPGVDNWQLVINFMVRVVSDINIGPTTTHVGVVSFGQYLKHFFVNKHLKITLSLMSVIGWLISLTLEPSYRHVKSCDCPCFDRSSKRVTRCEPRPMWPREQWL